MRALLTTAVFFLVTPAYAQESQEYAQWSQCVEDYVTGQANIHEHESVAVLASKGFAQCALKEALYANTLSADTRAAAISDARKALSFAIESKLGAATTPITVNPDINRVTTTDDTK